MTANRRSRRRPRPPAVPAHGCREARRSRSSSLSASITRTGYRNAMIAGPAGTGTRSSTQIVTCSSLCRYWFLQSRSPLGGIAVTSIQQRDAQSVLAGIDELLPALRERAQATEDLRRLPDETVEELSTRSASSSCCSPSSGVACSAIRRSSTRPSAGWPARAVPPAGWPRILGVHNWHLAQFDQQAQDEVWGEDPTVRVSSSYAPMGAGTVVDGGYLVNGAWNWSSGCDHATWAFLGGPVIKDGKPVDFGSFLIPRTEYRSTTSGTSSACAAPAATPSSSRTCSCRGTASCPTGR